MSQNEVVLIDNAPDYLGLEPYVFQMIQPTGLFLDSIGQKPQIPARLRPYTRSVGVRTDPKINRNSPCPCGSGLKFKKCCNEH